MSATAVQNDSHSVLRLVPPLESPPRLGLVPPCSHLSYWICTVISLVLYKLSSFWVEALCLVSFWDTSTCHTERMNEKTK